jgi:hypothetical protein
VRLLWAVSSVGLGHVMRDLASVGAWRNAGYAAIVGDEAFWLLSGFVSGWAPKPAPFIFLTDFIGTKAMTPSFRERWQSWHQNLRFTFSHRGSDAYVYIGSAGEIPDELMAVGVPFVALPLDHHFEQEAFVAHRLRHHGVGRVATLRDHPPEALAAMAEAAMGRPVPRISVDDGGEIADVVLQAASRSAASRVPRAPCGGARPGVT